jgi:uncharacterized protein YdiU (UPF0061 family)
MTISGETIDYGPCAFLEAYDPRTVFSSIDHQGRYAYGNQPAIAQWNLARLAETLLPLIAADESEAAAEQAVAQATEVLDAFDRWHAQALLAGRRAKLGLLHKGSDTGSDAGGNDGDDADDSSLADDWLALLREQRVDYTLAWRRLAEAAEGDAQPLRALFEGGGGEALDAWLARWHARSANEGNAAARAARLRQANPYVIPRNHRVEEALAAASDHGNLQPFERLLAAVRAPFDETPAQRPYGEPAPAELTAGYQTFCGT